MNDLAALHRRYRRALGDEPLPAALIDLDALDRNVDTVVAPARRAGKTVRVASKSVRCVELLRRIVARGGEAIRGVMAYSPAEASYLVDEGFRDILIAYPTAQPRDAALIAAANRRGAQVSIVADAPEHLAVLGAAARDAGVRIPVIVDLDVSYRPLGDRLHVGVRRSPLRTAEAVAALAQAVHEHPHLGFAGLMAYEAHIAGMPDHNAVAPLLDAPKRAVKQLARGPARALRAEVRRAVERRGLAVPLFNGGGTGSVAWSVDDPTLTEVAAGSGFVDSHLFDGYDGLTLAPAAFFALQITRRPGPGFVTCQSGGFIASGAPGPDRLPIPYLPEGLRLTGLEGAGEVQTPLLVPDGVHLEIGAPVFFRHAKAGELAEHFTTYLLVRDDRIEARAPTYRGAGHCFA
ncbi:L-gulono-1,4-lactone oxidase [Minicystis rosea]|nr:L-gulono-1,4-lactone oxidase [Minicystis rosea]